MGDVPVIVRLQWSDGLEEWRPARAIRWTRSHVMVGWRAEHLGAAPPPSAEQWAWLRAGDVMRSVSWLVTPGRTPASG